jgi:hypothetical protein
MVKVEEKKVVQGEGFVHATEGLIDNIDGGCELQPVKVEAADPTLHVGPFFAVWLELIFDKITPPTCQVFHDTYGLSNEGINSKCIRVWPQYNEPL